MASNRAKYWRTARMELLAQSSNVDLDKMAASLVSVIVSAPTLFEKRRFGKDMTGVDHEGGKKQKFDWGQRNSYLSAPYLSHVHIHCQIADTDTALRSPPPPAQSELHMDRQGVEVISGGEAEVRAGSKHLADFDGVGDDAKDCDQHPPVVASQAPQEIGLALWSLHGRSYDNSDG
jgi:hypothetical protein